MIPSLRVPVTRQRDDAGAAMMIAIMVVLVVAVLATSIATLATRSVRTAGDARTAGVVKDLANAGLSQGVTFLRDMGAASIDPTPAVPDGAGACQLQTLNTTSPLWSRSNPAQVNGGQVGNYKVWIEKISAPNGSNPGTYRVCSQGTSNQGSRTASVRAQYTAGGSASGLYAVYSSDHVTIKGSGTTTGLSAFSEECIELQKDDALSTGNDPSGRPIAAHAMSWVTGKNSACQASKSLHAAGPIAPAPNQYATDQAGGSVPSYASLVPWNGSTLEPATQSATAFRQKWGLADPVPFSSDQMLNYKFEAEQQGNAYENVGEGAVAIPDETNAIVYVKYTTGGQFDLKGLTKEFRNYYSHDTVCSSATARSLILVIDGRGVSSNGGGGGDIMAVVITNKGADMNGSFSIFGGLFAKEPVYLSGDGAINADSCAIAHTPPGGKAVVKVTHYVEYDRS